MTLEYLLVSFELPFEYLLDLPVETSKNFDSMVKCRAEGCVQASLGVIPQKLPIPLTQRGDVLDERAPE